MAVDLRPQVLRGAFVEYGLSLPPAVALCACGGVTITGAGVGTGAGAGGVVPTGAAAPSATRTSTSSPPQAARTNAEPTGASPRHAVPKNVVLIDDPLFENRSVGCDPVPRKASCSIDGKPRVSHEHATNTRENSTIHIRGIGKN